MELDPNVPIVGKNTKITFELKKSNNSISLYLMNSKVKVHYYRQQMEIIQVSKFKNSVWLSFC